MKLLCFALTLCALPAFAQLAPKPGTPDAEPRVYLSGKDLADMLASADAAAETGAAPGLKTLLLSGPFWNKLEYHKELPKGRPIQYRSNVNDAELILVLEGAGTIFFGGKLVNPVASGSDSFVSGAVDGGTAYKLVKGDMILIPEGAPHAITEVNGKFALMSLHLPHPAQAAAAAPAAGNTPAPGR